MNNQKGFVKIGTIILTIFLLIILMMTFNLFKENYFNGFEKATADPDKKTNFSRDSEIKYSDNSSYKLENVQYNDAAIYKEIEVEPNTPYRISCMVKTENVKNELDTGNGGVQIGLLETTEYCQPIEGTNDWQLMEYMFNSKNREKVKISFRIGGNENNCKGTVWFSDFKLEKGIRNTNTEWNVGCFIIKEIDVNIEGKRYNLKTNLSDIENVKLNMERFKNDCYSYSKERMSVNYEILEIDTPVTTVTYSDEHGYYLSYKDTKDLIYEIVKQKEYDHIFVVCRMEDEKGNLTIPIRENWIGLGGMDMYGIGYSLIRINRNSNTYTYKYGVTNQIPEEVYIHEFSHTLERNSIENGYETPELHDYEKYGYTHDIEESLHDWYKDYMSKEILNSSTGEYIGLDEKVYYTQPINSTNFKYSVDMDFNEEPKNLFENVLAVISVITENNNH